MAIVAVALLGVGRALGSAAVLAAQAETLEVALTLAAATPTGPAGVEALDRVLASDPLARARLRGCRSALRPLDPPSTLWTQVVIECDFAPGPSGSPRFALRMLVAHPTGQR